MHLYGNDIDDTTTPLEAGLEWNREARQGTFLGGEALSASLRGRGDDGGLVGSRCAGAASPVHGYPILSGGEPVGEVTSGTQLPTLGKALGARVRPASHWPPRATTIDIEHPCQAVAGEVGSDAFYSAAALTRKREGSRRMAQPSDRMYARTDGVGVKIEATSRWCGNARSSPRSSLARRVRRAPGGRQAGDQGRCAMGNIESVKAVRRCSRRCPGRSPPSTPSSRRTPS